MLLFRKTCGWSSLSVPLSPNRDKQNEAKKYIGKVTKGK